MEETGIALLLSLAVFPGLGHVVLHRRKTAILIMGCSLLALVVILYDLYQVARQWLQDFSTGLNDGDIATLENLLYEKLQSEPASQALIILLALWLASLVDTIRIGFNVYRASK